MLDWARKEIELAKQIECQGLQEGEFDYGGACYDSALKAYESLADDGHSGFSIKLTQRILNRLLDGKPLTPIVDIDDIWIDVDQVDDEHIMYQCSRMSSLFKYLYNDGKVEYSDISRAYCYNVKNKKTRYSSGLANRVLNEILPIKMPYSPSDKQIAIACTDFLTDRKNGDYDTVGILSAVMPNGKEILINRFFKEENHTWVEIDASEYDRRIIQSILLDQEVK